MTGKEESIPADPDLERRRIMATASVSEPDETLAPVGEDEPDWLTAERPEPNLDRPGRADYQDRSQPCEACE